jgi:hypothetical protein
MATTKLFKSTWNTYRITGYTHQVGTDPRATGGVHLHQVRRGTSGWQTRIVDSNGRYQSAGPVASLSTIRGESLFAMAKQR